MSHRPLVFVFGLTLGDYFLWNWSLNSNHDVLALISGLTLPPLAVAAVWLLALSLARLIAYTGRTRRKASKRRASQQRRTAEAAQSANAQSSAPSSAPSRKIAA